MTSARGGAHRWIDSDGSIRVPANGPARIIRFHEVQDDLLAAGTRTAKPQPLWVRG